MNLEKIGLKNKKILLISGVLLTLIIIGSIILIISQNKQNNEIVMQDNNNNKINNSFLTLMIEQEDGSYKESTSNTWPGEGYIFNSELSSCQNGGELDYDSENNKVILYSNKSDGCYVYFDIYNKPVINSINLTETTNNSITISVSATAGTYPISNYYYIINDGTPVTTTSNTYTFSGLSSGQTYTIKVYVMDTDGYSSDTSSLSVETENPILLADWVIEQYNGIQGNNGIYYHTSSLANSAGDNSYRYAGANPNNYVCFGSDVSTCPSDYLYRIIGVFENEVKLIKSTSYGNYVWDSENSNIWSSSYIRNSLNNIFLSTLSTKWSTKISMHSWKVGGGSYEYLRNSKAQIAYNYEVGINSINTINSAKIGLMYVSDYGYAAGSNYWSIILYDYESTINDNWLYLGFDEWTITRRSDRSNTSQAYYIRSIGDINSYVNDGVGNLSNIFNIRPTLYLNSDVTYVSGSGTQSDPIRIN